MKGLKPAYYIDGCEVDEREFGALTKSGAIVQCPNNNCVQYHGGFQPFVAGAGGATGYINFSELSQLNEWGERFYNNEQFEKQILEPRREAYKRNLSKLVASRVGRNPDYVYSYLTWEKTVNGNANFAVNPRLRLDLSLILNETNRYRTSGMPSAHIHTKDNYLIHLDMANPWTHFPLGALIHLFGDNILGRLNGEVPFIY